MSKSDCLRFQTIPNDTCLTKKESCVSMTIGVIAHYEFVCLAFNRYDIYSMIPDCGVVRVHVVFGA